MKKWLIALCCWLPLMSHASDVLTLDWIDLVPEQERQLFNSNSMPVLNHESEAAKQSMIGKVRNELNGSKVKIPGFVIPLEGDDKAVTEFLLVPYFGACIHVPPPPPNQIIYVKFKKKGHQYNSCGMLSMWLALCKLSISAMIWQKPATY